MTTNISPDEIVEELGYDPEDAGKFILGISGPKGKDAWLKISSFDEIPLKGRKIVRSLIAWKTALWEFISNKNDEEKFFGIVFYSDEEDFISLQDYSLSRFKPYCKTVEEASVVFVFSRSVEFNPNNYNEWLKQHAATDSQESRFQWAKTQIN